MENNGDEGSHMVGERPVYLMIRSCSRIRRCHEGNKQRTEKEEEDINGE